MEDDAGNVLPVPTAMRRYVQDVVLASGAPASNAYYASDGVVFENGGAVVGEARIRIPLVRFWLLFIAIHSSAAQSTVDRAIRCLVDTGG